MKTFGIVIPGGAGFVGRNLVRVLNSENYDMNEITVLNKDEKNLEYVKKYCVKTRRVDSVRKDDYAKTKLERETLVKNFSFKKKPLLKKQKEECGVLSE